MKNNSIKQLRCEEVRQLSDYNSLAAESFLPHREGKQVAFTLAEVMITLGVIGVVAAITMPQLIANISERVNSERQVNVAQKVTQAMEQMRALGKLDGSYNSTDAFVNELQKYLKISKRCSANEIADCWPTSTVIDSDGEEYTISDAKKGKNIHIFSNTSDNVRLILADGTLIILTYNQNTKGLDIGDRVTAYSLSLPVGGGKTKDFAYSTSVTAPIDFIMDVNGKKGPNKEPQNGKYYDIRSFKAARLGLCDAKVDNISGISCITNIGTSYEADGTIFVDYGPTHQATGTYDNNWQGAINACQAIGMDLPELTTLQDIYNEKDNYAGIPKTGWYFSKTTCGTGKQQSYYFTGNYSGCGRMGATNQALCVK